MCLKNTTLSLPININRGGVRPSHLTAMSVITAARSPLYAITMVQRIWKERIR